PEVPHESEERPAVEGGATVMVVEDERPLRALLSRVLVSRGYEVLGAGTAAAALEQVRAHTGPLDLVILDMVLPDRAGRDLAADLEALRPGLRFLFMSGFSLDDHLSPESACAAPFLQKPFSPKELAAKVREVL